MIVMHDRKTTMKIIAHEITPYKAIIDGVEKEFTRVHITTQLTDKEYPQRLQGFIFESETEAKEFLQKSCTHEALTDTGENLLFCPICDKSWVEYKEGPAEKYDLKDITNELSQFHRGLSAISSQDGIFVGGKSDGQMYARRYNSDKMTSNEEVYYRTGEVWLDEKYGNHFIVYRPMLKARDFLPFPEMDINNNPKL